MVRKGVVSSIDEAARTAKVVFPDLDRSVTANIRFAKHVTLVVNDMVAVAFFSDNLSDGLIIGVF